MSIVYHWGAEHVAIDTLLHLLHHHSYWGKTRPAELIAKSLRGSLCLSAWEGQQMLGFGRVVSDYAIFAYLADVIVDPERRGQGIGKVLVKKLCGHPAIRTCRIQLNTADAHPLYESYGFRPVSPGTEMVRPSPAQGPALWM
jgi:GNAT superfamily N-acetyltransferase